MASVSQTQARRAIAALVLAAGQSARMGGPNKLLAELDGLPLVQRTVRTLGEACVRPVIVVTGHEGMRIREVLANDDVILVHNPDYATGLSSSLRCGLGALPPETEGVLVCLADMPCVRATDIERLIAAFAPEGKCAICVPIFAGRRGNPVLWARCFVPEMMELTGDTGARALLGRYAACACEVDCAGSGVLIDVDTPEDLAALRAERSPE